MSLREKQSAARRRQMLDAAESLIRTTGGTDFSMLTLADAAEVSAATPYNFFGTKEGLLFELLNINLQTFFDEGLSFKAADPLGQVIETGENVVTIILRDPVLLRPLYKVLLGLSDPVHHPKFLRSAFLFYWRALASAREAGIIPTDEDRNMTASALMSHTMGVLDLWVHEDIADDWFRAKVIHSFVLQLWPSASGAGLDFLAAKLAAVRAVLTDPELQPAFVG